MTTIFLDNKCALSKFHRHDISHKKKKQCFWTIFLSAPSAPAKTQIIIFIVALPSFLQKPGAKEGIFRTMWF